jgi:leucyl/phenylalanyl-tRNA--protein transferase
MTHGKNKKTLDADFVVMAYCHGYFPMADARSGRISWYSPDPRAIIPLEDFNISRSLKQALRKRIFDIRIDTAFDQVIRSCAGREETWISNEIISVYTELHRRGLAHCVESWHNGKLAGGLYGVAIGGAFFGESMFSHMTNASKVALVHLVDRLKRRGFRLLDTQFMNEHMRQFGALEISRASYLKLLAEAIVVATTFVDT